jgi:hypothetical protein
MENTFSSLFLSRRFSRYFPPDPRPERNADQAVRNDKIVRSRLLLRHPPPVKHQLRAIGRQDSKRKLEDLQKLIRITDIAYNRQLIKQLVQGKIFSKGKQNGDYGRKKPE